MDKFYVYAYLEPSGAPFYIGKGCDSRLLNHLTFCRNKATRNKCRDFYAKLRKMLDAGIEPEIIRLVVDLSLPAARKWERATIDEIGRIDLGTGPLTNLTDGSKPGPKSRQRTSKSLAKWHASLTPDEKQQWIEAVTAGYANMTPEEKKHHSIATAKARLKEWAAMTEKEREQRAAKIVAGQVAMPEIKKQEQRIAQAKTCKTTWANKTEKEKKRISTAEKSKYESKTKKEKQQHAKAIKAGRAKMTTKDRQDMLKAQAIGRANRTDGEKKIESANRSKAQKARRERERNP